MKDIYLNIHSSADTDLRNNPIVDGEGFTSLDLDEFISAVDSANLHPSGTQQGESSGSDTLNYYEREPSDNQVLTEAFMNEDGYVFEKKNEDMVFVGLMWGKDSKFTPHEVNLHTPIWDVDAPTLPIRYDENNNIYLNGIRLERANQGINLGEKYGLEWLNAFQYYVPDDVHALSSVMGITPGELQLMMRKTDIISRPDNGSVTFHQLFNTLDTNKDGLLNSYDNGLVGNIDHLPKLIQNRIDSFQSREEAVDMFIYANLAEIESTAAGERLVLTEYGEMLTSKKYSGLSRMIEDIPKNYQDAFDAAGENRGRLVSEMHEAGLLKLEGEWGTRGLKLVPTSSSTSNESANLFEHPDNGKMYVVVDNTLIEIDLPLIGEKIIVSMENPEFMIKGLIQGGWVATESTSAGQRLVPTDKGIAMVNRVYSNLSNKIGTVPEKYQTAFETAGENRGQLISDMLDAGLMKLEGERGTEFKLVTTSRSFSYFETENLFQNPDNNREYVVVEGTLKEINCSELGKNIQHLPPIAQEHLAADDPGGIVIGMITNGYVEIIFNEGEALLSLTEKGTEIAEYVQTYNNGTLTFPEYYAFYLGVDPFYPNQRLIESRVLFTYRS